MESKPFFRIWLYIANTHGYHISHQQTENATERHTPKGLNNATYGEILRNNMQPVAKFPLIPRLQDQPDSHKGTTIHPNGDTFVY